MARDGVVQEETQHHVPMDVMVATFADRQAAKDAYQTLRAMDKEGRIGLDGAVVIDRDQMGKVHLKGAVLPGWLWAVFAVAMTVASGLLGLVVWGMIRAISSMGGRREGEGDQYSETERRMEQEMRGAME